MGRISLTELAYVVACGTLTALVFAQTAPRATAVIPVAAETSDSKPIPLMSPFDEKTAKASQKLWADYLRVQPEISNTLGMKFALIPPATFTMGSAPDEPGQRGADLGDDETQHKVILTKPFAMGVYPVTVGQFRKFIQATGYKPEEKKDYDPNAFTWNGSQVADTKTSTWNNPGFAQNDDHPVVCVDWYDAKAFCGWLNKTDGKSYRLPTEAEWEYSCRAGTATAYPWGDNPDDGKGWANCLDLIGKEQIAGRDVFNWSDGFVFTSPVGNFKANAFGLYDMIGNVLQWCHDSYGDYPPRKVTDPQGPDTHAHILRGGSWYHSPQVCRSGQRFTRLFSSREGFTGFRIVLDLALPQGK